MPCSIRNSVGLNAAACHSAGFTNISAAYAIQNYGSANTSLPILLANVQCGSGAAGLETCTYSFYPPNSWSGYSHTNDVGVDCSGVPRPPEPIVAYSATVSSSTTTATFASNLGRLLGVSTTRIQIISTTSNGTAGFEVIEFRFTDNTTATYQTRWYLDNELQSESPYYIQYYLYAYSLSNNLTAAVLPTMQFRLVGGASNTSGIVQVRP